MIWDVIALIITSLSSYEIHIALIIFIVVVEKNLHWFSWCDYIQCSSGVCNCHRGKHKMIITVPVVWVNRSVIRKHTESMNGMHNRCDVLSVSSQLMALMCVTFAWISSVQITQLLTIRYLHFILMKFLILKHIFSQESILTKSTHWGPATLICVSKLTNTGSDNGLLLGRRQTIIWTSAGIFVHFHSRKIIWKYNLRNSGKFVSASVC